MSLDINWTFTVIIPQLDALGAQLMDRLTGIENAILDLGTQQAAGTAAIAAQLTVVANEISQLNAETIQAADLARLEQQIRAAAKIAEDQAAAIRANSQQIASMVPDPPAPSTP